MSKHHTKSGAGTLTVYLHKEDLVRIEHAVAVGASLGVHVTKGRVVVSAMRLGLDRLWKAQPDVSRE